MNELLKLDNQLCFAVYALSREITRIYRPFLNELGLTYTQYIVMLVLWEKDGIALRLLGRKLSLDSGTLTPLLKKLESQGLIERKRDIKDERNLILFLTDDGRELMKAAENVPGEIACRLPIDMDEIVDLRESLKNILRNLKNTDPLTDTFSEE